MGETGHDAENVLRLEIHSVREDAPAHLIAWDEENHYIHMDTLEIFGGAGRGIRPLKVMLASLGACAGMDAVAIMRKMRLPLKGIRIVVEAEKEPDSKPTRLTRIHMKFEVCGKELSEERVARAIELAVEKYCAVGQIVRKAVPITYEFTIREKESLCLAGR